MGRPNTYQPGPTYISEALSAIPQRYDPTVLVDYGVITSSFSQHQARPSKDPGVDVNVRRSVAITATLPKYAMPAVRSPATGVVVQVKPEPWGNVTIEDCSGYRHKLLHNTNIMVEVGQRVHKAQTVAQLGSVAPPNSKITGPHVHHVVTRPEEQGGSRIDPDGSGTSYDLWTGAVIFDDNEWVGRFCNAADTTEKENGRGDAGSAVLDRFRDAVENAINRVNSYLNAQDRSQ